MGIIERMPMFVCKKCGKDEFDVYLGSDNQVIELECSNCDEEYLVTRDRKVVAKTQIKKGDDNGLAKEEE